MTTQAYYNILLQLKHFELRKLKKKARAIKFNIFVTALVFRNAKQMFIAVACQKNV